MFKTKKSFHLLFFLIWAIVFLGPYLRNMQYADPLSVNRMVGEWIFLFILLLVFLINLYVLVPKYLFKDKRLRYLIMLSITIFAGIILDVILHQLVRPVEITNTIDRSYDFNNNAPFEQFSLVGTVFNNLIISLLIIGSSTAFELFYKWLSEERLRKDIEKEQLKTSLALLRHQVSPHFFMNTLNNIHTLIEISSARAQDGVERLSTLMRYLLYDSAQNSVDLKKEIEFIESFISLMQLRHSDEVEVKVNFPEVIPSVKIPPMLFISLLENAFKHGVNYPQKSYIHLIMMVDESFLCFNIKNSKHKIAAKSYGEFSGIGLENIKDSLYLLYKENYKLDIFNRENEFEVNLKIPL
ncbi:MAG: histidine kinase [Bacteroidetes bacterium]|nr:histidine kinase [Bacteroidota bacterium]